MTPGTPPMADPRARAAAVLARREQARATRDAALARRTGKLSVTTLVATAAAESPATTFQTAGYLVALGDSWFAYPGHNVLTKLYDEHGYNFESAANNGARVESIAYGDGQFDDFSRSLDKLKSAGHMPKAVLVSAGGDDIAGGEFGMLLNSARSPIHGWNDDVLTGVIHDRIGAAYGQLLDMVNFFCEQQLGKRLPVLVHGYDYAVPDGRGFLWGWPWPGPWLRPGFDEKGFTVLSANVDLLQVLIDRFNAMLTAFAAAHSDQVHYVNLRNTLSHVLTNDAYKDWWANELHPTGDGFSAVANKFAAVLDAV